MESFMKNLREHPLTEVCGKKIVQIKDYSLGLDGLPKSNVISFFGEDFSLIIRPSGTEPKMKVYITAQAETKKDSLTLLGALEQEVENLLGKN
jgi:phosphoglucomutase